MNRGATNLERWLQPQTPQFRAAIVAACLAVPLAGAAIVYVRFLDQWFLTDDVLWLRAAANPNFWSFLKGAFTFPRGPTPYWRPLIDFYFFGMYRVFALHALPYHIANLLWHGAVAAQTVLLLRRVGRSLLAGVVGGLVFAVAPSYETVVPWVSASTELISVFFCIATVLLFLRYIEGDGGRGTLALASVAFAAALLAKETSAVLPAMMVILGSVAVLSRGAVDVKRLALALLPFVVLDAAYLGLQLALVVFNSSTSHYEIGWAAAGRLRERMLWLSWPLPDWYSSSANTAQWAVLLSFSAMAFVALLRRYWVLPALYACTVLALLPTSFVTESFAPRWVYLATVPWAGFLGLLIALAVTWLLERNRLLAAVTLAAVLSGLGVAFLPRTLDAQRWMPAQASQMQQIATQVQGQCDLLGPGRSAYILPLPVVDPGYAVPTLIRLVRPGADVVTVSGKAAKHPPGIGDCIVDFDDGHYKALQVDERYVAGPFWTQSVAYPCPAAVPWQEADRHVGEMVIASGPIAAVDRDAGGRFLRLDIGQSGKLVVLVQPSDPVHSPVPAGQDLLGRTVCVKGIVHAAYGVIPLIPLRWVDAIAPQS